MSIAAAAAPAPAVAFEVLDVLGGFASLTRRAPTLGGSVPVRVAQGCLPLLEGNAWGYQVALRGRIELVRRWGRWTVSGFAGGEELERLARASVPLLVRDGTLRPEAGAWVRRLERGVIAAGRTISLFTGLFARPRPGVRLRQSQTANRRSWSYRVGEAILDDCEAPCPIVLDIEPAPGVTAFALEGEIATLAALPARIAFAQATIDDAPEVAAAHTQFYDADYFATKRRGAVVRKYRDAFGRAPKDAATGDEVRAWIVEAGPAQVAPAAPVRLHRASGPIDAPPGTPPDRAIVRNAVAFSAVFDGVHVAIEPDRAQLAAYARDVRSRWAPWLARAGADAHEGSLLYLTKYFTPHPPGEPHMFVKPCALVRTSPGTSSVLDGICGEGYDVLRGVVRTDAFHAAPAVFQLWRPGQTIVVPRGAPLLAILPGGRALFEAGFSLGTAGAAGGWSA